MSARYNEIRRAPEITLKGEISHVVDLASSPSGNITRINNALDSIAEKIAGQNEKLEDLHKQVQTAKEEISRPFPRETELREKLEQLNEINAELNLGGREIQPDEEIPTVEAAKGTLRADEKDALIEQAKQKLGENSIVTDAQKCRSYSGEVLEVGESYAVQKISRGAGVVHSLNKAPELKEMLEANGKENICVAYDKSGKCSVTPAENSQDQNREEAVSY
jgi:chromosome segregation ATPase